MSSESIDKALLKGLANHDTKVIEILYKQHFGLIQSLIIQNNGSFDDARDIFQDAMMVLYEKAKDENFVLTAQVKTYLYSISWRLWLKKLQKAKKTLPALTELLEEIPVEEEIELKEKLDQNFEIMGIAMKNLGEPCRSLIESYYMKKKHMLEIAEEFGYTNADNAKNQKYKCLLRLKKLFFAQHKTI